MIKAIDRGYEIKLRSFFWANKYSDKEKLCDADAATALAAVNLIDQSVIGASASQRSVGAGVVASEDNFVQLCEQYIRTVFAAELIPMVSLKFMRSNEFFVREVMVRASAEFDDRYVIDVNREDDLRMLTEAMDLFPAFCRNGFEKFQHVVILQGTVLVSLS